MKIFAIDLDGTLLSDDHRVTKINQEAIQLAEKRGHIIVIATGRSVYSAKDFLKILGVDGFVVALNGAVILDSVHQKVIYKKALPTESIVTMLETGRQYQVNVSLCGLEKNYQVDFSGAINELVQEFKPGQTPFEQCDFESIQYVIGQSAIFKVGIMCEDIELLKEMKHSLNENGLPVIFSDTHYIELMADGIDKGSGIRFVSERLGMDRKHVISFGDQENDIGLIKFSGTSYAMGNAKQSVKELSSFVIETNNESGVGKQILKLLKEEMRQSDAK